MNERTRLHAEWEASRKAKEVAEAEKIRLTEMGNEIFASKYNNSFATYDEEAGDPLMDGYWEDADKQSDLAIELGREAEELYRKLEESVPDEFLAGYESCATVGRSFKKQVRVKFLNGEVKVGYIYPIEGDYCGPPYYLVTDRGTEHINYGEMIHSVELLETT